MDILQYLRQNERLSETDAAKIERFEAEKPFSLHWELSSLLYLGVLMLNVGLGILVYQNIDSIGHAVIIALIGVLSLACFGYAFRHRKPFSLGQVDSPTPYFDNVLLLGCLLFLIMEGYWQYQYQIFGERYGLATFVPMLVFFGVAYFFDHKGVLSLGITCLATWVGVTVTPLDLLRNNDFDSPQLVHTGALLGLFLIALAFLTEKMGLKRHFSSIYVHFSIHILMLSCLAGLMQIGEGIVFAPLLLLAVAFFIWYARKTDSLFFLTMSILYGYIGMTYLFFHLGVEFAYSIALYYFLFSCVGVIYFFLNYKKLLRN